MQLNTDQFLWQKGQNTFTAEISSLGWDQVPQEFQLKSERTGNVVLMRGVRVERDCEGDTAAWVYKPVSSLSFSLTVFND